jgi:pantoate--beta-alanine ligase
MHIVRMPISARAITRVLPRPLGFVPTMGALHLGHIALVERARAENRAVAVSIFVNPLQFTSGEDYERYPRVFEGDVALLEAAGVAVLYAPSVEHMYPPGFQMRLEPGEIGEHFEGAIRPGHFAGVAVAVAKLMHAIEPTTLYVGRKDAQQAVMLAKMVADLDMPVKVTVCEIVRESDGLALSSRNALLDASQRRAAPSLYRALSAARAEIERGQTDPASVRATASACIESPLELEYLDVVDQQRFTRQSRVARPALIIAAARVGHIRLIDNVPV